MYKSLLDLDRYLIDVNGKRRYEKRPPGAVDLSIYILSCVQSSIFTHRKKICACMFVCLTVCVCLCVVRQKIYWPGLLLLLLLHSLNRG